MEEEFLDGYLLGDGTVGIALETDTLLGCLQAHLLDVALQDGLVADDPYDFVDDGATGSGDAVGSRRLILGLTCSDGRGTVEHCRAADGEEHEQRC